MSYKVHTSFPGVSPTKYASFPGVSPTKYGYSLTCSTGIVFFLPGSNEYIF